MTAPFYIWNCAVEEGEYDPFVVSGGDYFLYKGGNTDDSVCLVVGGVYFT